MMIHEYSNFMEAAEVARTQKDPNLLISIKNKFVLCIVLLILIT